MKQDFNKYERIAGLFILLAAIGLAGLTTAVIVQKGWFASKASYHTFLQTAGGIHIGTNVHIFGLKAGWVEDVELVSAGKVKITFEVLEKYKSYVTKDSHVQVIRPFVVGEKVIELSIGEEGQALVEEGGYVASITGIDVVDLLSGRLLGPLMDTLSAIAEDMQMFTNTLNDRDLKTPLTKLVNQVEPLISNMNNMSREVAKMTGSLNDKQLLVKNMQALQAVTEQLNAVMPELLEHAPEMAERMPVLINNMVEMSSEIHKLTPAMAELAPQIPAATQRAIDAVEEAVVTMKALQKSFLLKGKVKAVRKEMQLEQQPEGRVID